MIFNCGDLLELLGPVRGNLGRVVVSRAFRVVRGLALSNSKRSGPTRMLLGNFNPAIQSYHLVIYGIWGN